MTPCPTVVPPAVRPELWSLPLLVAAPTSAGWYLAEHPSDQRLSSCAVVVGLHPDSQRGARMALALSGQLQYVVHSGLNRRPVVTEDGRDLRCTPLQRMP